MKQSKVFVSEIPCSLMEENVIQLHRALVYYGDKFNEKKQFFNDLA